MPQHGARPAGAAPGARELEHAGELASPVFELAGCHQPLGDERVGAGREHGDSERLGVEAGLRFAAVVAAGGREGADRGESRLPLGLEPPELGLLA